MPWHDVQYLKITGRAGPFGGTTCGRVGRGASWPADVATDAQNTQNKQNTQSSQKPQRLFTENALWFLRSLPFLRVLRFLGTATPSPAAAVCRCSSRSCPDRCRTGAGCSTACWTCAACCRETQDDGSP